MSAVQSIKDRLLAGGLKQNKDKPLDPKINDKAKLAMMNPSKNRSSSSSHASNNQHVSHNLIQNQAHYQNLSRKAFQPTSANAGDKVKQNKEAGLPGQQKKKVNLSLLMMNPIEDFNKEQENQAALIKEREIAEKQQKANQVDNLAIHDEIHETLSKMKQKIQSAQRRMDLNFAKGTNKKEVNAISIFDPSSEKENNIKASKSGEDLLTDNYASKFEDHSDIKFSQQKKEYEESTALMTGKLRSSSSGGNQLSVTPDYEASQFTLNVQGDKIQKTPSQFQPNASKKSLQNTDELGNRLSLLPSAKRPKIPSTKKKDCESKKKSDASQHKAEEEPVVTEFKNNLDRIQEEVKEMKIKQQSKGIVKERTNFVKQNLMKGYKPRMRGAAFSNKIMAKKRNQLKNIERFKRKMQIEQAKNRDQVNAYGGLGKVGLDHGEKNSASDGEEKPEELVPTFSTSAMKYLKKIVEHEEAAEVEEFLAEDLEKVNDQLENIDEEVKEEQSIDPENEDFDKALYAKIPQTDQEYLDILKARFGHTSFKEGQLEAIKILLEKKDNALVVLATGGGKSLIYQYVSMFMPGLILIITPLISLMTDQLNKLPSFLPGAAFNSQQSFIIKKQVYAALSEKKIKLLFISPERFFIEDFTKFNRKISLACVDEIHCASEWSHNFRPTYLKINDMIREKLGNSSDKVTSKAVVLGLTATATKATQKSICEIFDIKFPEHRITQEDLSRINLQLSITRDHEKQKSLLVLLKSDSFKKLESILIYATHKRTCELLASFLTQNGIQSQAYHAGKTDTQRQVIQKCFTNNQIRVLVCTIAFSMGIDKSDIQSVIHYDMPKSIENYVQEIGRAGRDGKLARCHLFLNNDDFFLIRRLILTDLLDNYNALKLTNKIIVEAKRHLISIVNPSLVVNSKKRKIKQISNENECEEYTKIIDEFEHEKELQKYYTKDEEDDQLKIQLEQFEDGDHYVFLDVKEQQQVLDLKREVIMTMLNSLEKLKERNKRLFKFEGVLPGSVGIRFHKSKPQEIAQKSEFIKSFLTVSKEHAGVHRCSIQKLAYVLKISPFQIPKILYNMQNSDGGEITYETDQECFVLKLTHIPYGGSTLDLSNEMLKETRRVEQNMVSKLNCMYFVARKVSLPTVEYMLKKEKNEDGPTMYKGFSKQLNDLINLYFNIAIEEDMEIQIAGNKEERDIMLPLQRIETHREKAEIESEIKMLLRDFHDQGQSSIDPNERMKALDIVKIMMGIYSDRANIKRFMNNSKVWAKFQEYDNDEIYKIASATVNQYYLDQITGGSGGGTTNTNAGTISKDKDASEMISSGPTSKKRRLND